MFRYNSKKKGFSNWKHFLKNNAKEDLSDSNNVLKKQSLKNEDPYRNLIVLAINKLLDHNYISLNIKNSNDKENGHVILDLCGYLSLIQWSNRGFDELLISVWWKYDHNKHPQANLEGNLKERFTAQVPLAKKQHYRKFVGVVASCWLERKSGKYLQGENRNGISNIYTRKGEMEELKQIPIQEPKGFGISGPFHM